jgi:hypothetical protein
MTGASAGHLAAEDAVFLDVEQLKPGNLWEEKLVGAVQQSSIFVLCWCCQSEKSEFVAKEISIALTDKSKKLVPVFVLLYKTPLKSRGQAVDRSPWSDRADM